VYIEIYKICIYLCTCSRHRSTFYVLSITERRLEELSCSLTLNWRLGRI